MFVVLRGIQFARFPLSTTTLRYSTMLLSRGSLFALRETTIRARDSLSAIKIVRNMEQIHRYTLDTSGSVLELSIDTYHDRLSRNISNRPAQPSNHVASFKFKNVGS